MTRKINTLLRTILIILLLGILIVGCSKQEGALPAAMPIAPPTDQAQATPAEPPLSSSLKTEPKPHRKRLPGKRAGIQSGVIGPIRTTGGRGQSPSLEATTRKARVLAFNQAPIPEVAAAILGKELGLEYTVAPEVDGDISLHIEGDYGADELLLLFAEALGVYSLDLVERDGLFAVRPMQAADGLELAGPGMTRSSAPEVVVYRLRYVDAEQASKVIKGFLGKDRPIAAYPGTNAVVFAERPLAARRIVQLLRALDMNILGEVGFEIVPLAAVPPQEAVNRLKEIISGVGQLKGSVVDASTVFVPLERLPGVLVISPHPEALRTVRQWLTALDVHTDAAGDQVMVYHMENGLASKVAPILQELFTSESSNTKNSIPTSSEKNENEQPIAAAVAKGADLSGLVAELSGQALIIADEENNAIVVRANAADLVRIREVIQTLDIMPRAVLIKMVIAEVDLSDELRYGVEWFLRTNNIDYFGSAAFDTGTGFDQSFSLGGSGAGLIPGGLSLFAGSIGTWDDFAALVNLLDAKNKVQILSTPTLLAMDNTAASFTVGGREPTISRVSKDASTDSSIVNDISYQDTGIILSVTPHINSSGLVRLEVDQRITSVNPQAVPGVDLNTPRFTERQLKTSLIAQSGATMVIGGIIQQNATKARTGVPILSDIPVLSFFASTTTKERKRTELLIAVTPHVVSQNSDPVSRELIDKLEHMQRQMELDMQGGKTE